MLVTLYCCDPDITIDNVHILSVEWGDSIIFAEEDVLPSAKEYVKEKYRLEGRNPDEVAQADVDCIFRYMKLNWVVSEHSEI